MSLGSLRDMFEGLFYRSAIVSSHARRAHILRRGIRPIREAWWTPLRYESQRALWHNIRLLETSPEPRKFDAVFPEHARVAVMTPGHVGDVLHAAPLIRAVRKARPSADITWIVGPWCAALASRYRAADRVEVFSPAWFQYRRGGAGADLREQISWGKTRPETDVFLSTANADLTTLFVGRCYQPSWWCGRPPASDLYRVAPREDIVAADRNRYESEDILRIAEPLGVSTGDATLSYVIAEEEMRRAQSLLADRGIADGVPYAVISPGAGWPGKQWPVDRWARVADELHLMGLSVVLAGTRAELPLCRHVQRLMRSAAVQAAGETTLEELAAIMAGARIWLGSDSGGLHLAAAVGTATVSLFGPTSPAKWAPRGSGHRHLRAVDGCPSCVPWHPRANCPEGGACMLKISIDSVRAAAADILETRLKQEMVTHE